MLEREIEGEGWYLRETLSDDDVIELYGASPTLFTLKFHHGGRLTNPPRRIYVAGKVSHVDFIDVDLLSVHEVDLMMSLLGYCATDHIYYQFCEPGKNLDDGLIDLSNDMDVLKLGQYVAEHKIIDVYTIHGLKNIKAFFASPTKRSFFASPTKRTLTIEEIDESGPFAIIPARTLFKSVHNSEAGQSSGIGSSSGIGQSNVVEEHTRIEVEFEQQTRTEVEFEQQTRPEVVLEDDVLEDVVLEDDVLEDVVLEDVVLEDHVLKDDVLEDDVLEDDDNEHLNGDSEEDTDFIVDEENAFVDYEVDMRDYMMNIDLEVDDNNFSHHHHVDTAEEMLNNDAFPSDSDSDGIDSSIRKHPLNKIRREQENRENESMANFFVGQVFGTKDEAKKLIKKLSVETRRMIKIIKDDKVRVRAVCQGPLPDFDIDINGVHVNSQKKVVKGKGKGKVTEVGKQKGPNEKVGKQKGPNEKVGKQKGPGGKVAKDKGPDVNVGGRGKKTNPEEYQCPWALLVSKVSGQESWVVRTFITEHKCIQTRSIRACTSTFLSEQMLEQVEENPEIPVRAVQEQFQRKFEVGVSKMKAYRARAKAKQKVEGDYNSQYALLRDYCIELKDKNPDTTIKIEVEPDYNANCPTRTFKSIYVCLGALKRGFKAIGRDLLGLDGAFMKGPYPGQILTAVGIDPNNGIYPVCYAILEAENYSSWAWFLDLLGDDLDLGSNSNFTFISDRQKGLLPAVSKLYPCAEHRYCLRHIHENMKGSFRGKLYKKHLWNCASATTVPEFKTAMDELKKFNKAAHLWLSKIPPLHWSRSHFSGRALSDVMLNNMCEVYNGKIVEGRDKPIISALEYIREYCMRRIVTVLKDIERSEGLLTPYATNELETIKKDATFYHVQWNGGDIYQVSGKPNHARVVDLVKKTCSCRAWEIRGIPCRHAVAAIWCMATNGQRVGALESWVNPIYTMERWKQVYEHKVNPINGRSLWVKCQVPTTLLPPKHHKQVGRPKKARKRSAMEVEELTQGGKLSKKNTKGKCGKCGNTGHNKRTCKGQGQGA